MICGSFDSSGSCSALIENRRHDSPEDQHEDDGKEDKSVAGDAFLISQGAQPADAAGGQVADELGIGGRGGAKEGAHAPKRAEQIVFAHAEVIIVAGAGFEFGLGARFLAVEPLEDGFARGRRRGQGGRRFGQDGAAAWDGGGTDARVGAGLFDFAGELPNLRLERVNFRAQFPGSGGDGIGLFAEKGHGRVRTEFGR
jgi:hypothetical protein